MHKSILTQTHFPGIAWTISFILNVQWCIELNETDNKFFEQKSDLLLLAAGTKSFWSQCYFTNIVVFDQIGKLLSEDNISK